MRLVPDEGGAATVAAAKVAAVRDDPRARLALASSTYRGPTGDAPRHLPFRRAAMSFMHWEAERGVLNALDAEPPGSRWWRALNERLLRDGCEAVARAGGHGGSPSTPTIRLWDAFVERPTARTWYRAHNASIVAAYLDHRDLAEAESRTERFFLNVVLLRVLYAHALVAARLCRDPAATGSSLQLVRTRARSATDHRARRRRHTGLRLVAHGEAGVGAARAVGDGEVDEGRNRSTLSSNLR